MRAAASITIGTAGWSISRLPADRFAADGSSLARYGAVLAGVEVNSSFYRRHRLATWQRWYDAVPEAFRFAVKMPKVITHDLRLVDAASELAVFFADIEPLGSKLGPLLVQLPPALAFEPDRDRRFLAELRQRTNARVVIEPRHVSWAGTEAKALLAAFAIDRVYADPQQAQLRNAVDRTGFVYLRLHGAPRIYFSAYTEADLGRFAALLAGAAGGAWCIFDNTAASAALGNALDLEALVRNDEGPDLRLAL